MLHRLLIIGAGGHGRSIAESALLSGRWNDIAFADDNYPKKTTTGGWPIISDSNNLANALNHFNGVVVAMGNNSARAEKLSQLEALNAPIVSIVHPRAFVSATAELGAGTTVMANATIGANAVIGRGCILNANSCADHDSQMGDFAHLGVGVVLAGGVKVGTGAFMQAGTFAGYHSEIAPWVTLVASSDFREA